MIEFFKGFGANRDYLAWFCIFWAIKCQNPSRGLLSTLVR